MSSTATSSNIRAVGLAFGGLVAGVAAVASYVHMRELIHAHSASGSEWLSWLIPLSVDGLMVVASIVVVNARRNPPATVPPLAIVAICVALVISLIANALAPAADIVGKVINAWPAAAFAFGYELVLMLVRMEVKARPARKPKTDKTAPAAVVPSPAASGVPSSDVPAPRAAVEPDAAPAAGTSLRILPGAGEALPIAGAPEWLTDDLRSRPRDAMLRYLDEHGDTTGAELDRFGAQYLGTKPTLGRKVRAAWLAQEQQKASGE